MRASCWDFKYKVDVYFGPRALKTVAQKEMSNMCASRNIPMAQRALPIC